jgi:di/tricarboxylate transporter
MIGGLSCFLNSTPIVVLGAPVIRDIARTLGQSPKRYLMPLSYITVLTGCCTLVGTSTNLLVDDMASIAGQARFGIFEITPVGLPIALAGGLYLYFVSGRLLRAHESDERDREPGPLEPIHIGNAQVGDATLFAQKRPSNRSRPRWPLPSLPARSRWRRSGSHRSRRRRSAARSF